MGAAAANLDWVIGKKIKNPDGAGSPTVTIVGWGYSADKGFTLAHVNPNTNLLGDRPFRGAVIVPAAPG